MEYLFSLTGSSGNINRNACSDYYYQKCTSVAQTNVSGPCDVCQSTCAATCWDDCSNTCFAAARGVCEHCNFQSFIIQNNI